MMQTNDVVDAVHKTHEINSHCFLAARIYSEVQCKTAVF